MHVSHFSISCCFRHCLYKFPCYSVHSSGFRLQPTQLCFWTVPNRWVDVHTLKSNTCASFLLLSTHSWIKRHFGCFRQFQYIVSICFKKKRSKQAKSKDLGRALPLLKCQALGAQSPWSQADQLLASSMAHQLSLCCDTGQPRCLPTHPLSRPLLSHQQTPPSPARPSWISRNACGNASTSLSPLSCLAGWRARQPLQC